MFSFVTLLITLFVWLVTSFVLFPGQVTAKMIFIGLLSFGAIYIAGVYFSPYR